MVKVYNITPGSPILILTKAKYNVHPYTHRSNNDVLPSTVLNQETQNQAINNLIHPKAIDF